MQQRANRPDPCQPFEKRRIARQLAKLPKVQCSTSVAIT